MTESSLVLPNVKPDYDILSSLFLLGASYFPVHVELTPETGKCIKRPLIKEWQKTTRFSITSKEQFNGAFAFGFHPETIGAIVIDLDSKGGKNGEETLRNLLGEKSFECIEHPEVYVDTPNGRHLYFSRRGIPQDCLVSRNNVASGIDVRASAMGGWLVAPGSVGWSERRQEWMRYEPEGDFSNLPQMPEELINLLSSWIPKPESIPSFITPDSNPTVHYTEESNDDLRKLFELVSNLIRVPQFFSKLVEEYVPNARWNGRDYETGDYEGNPGASCRWTPATGIIKDFNDPGKGMDFLGWMARSRSMVSAARSILSSLGIPDPSTSIKQIQAEAAAAASPATPVLTGIYPFTDTGNGEMFVELARGHLIYNAEADYWLMWDGMVWNKDTGMQVQQMAKLVARTITQRASTCTDDALIKRMTKWGKDSEGDNRRKAMISCAKSEPEICRTDEQFDKHPYLLNTKSGVVDLKTGKITPHNPELLITQLCPYEVSNEPPDKFLKFIDDIFLRSDEMIYWMQSYLGYCLTGAMDEQIFPVWYGEGQNGKSVLLAIISAIMGTYSKHSARGSSGR